MAGYRSVPLKNGYSDELELATLLVHVDKRIIGVSLYCWDGSVGLQMAFCWHGLYC